MNHQQNKCFVIYSRKSKVTGKGESVENQVEMCRHYIACTFSQQDADSALVYEDEGFSGGTLDRPQFKQMMHDSMAHNFSAIVVYRLDRISRNIGDFAKLIEELGQRGIGFISIREQFDTSSPMGRAMMYIASVFSQLERETIAERIRDNMHELAKTGRWLGGNTPTGYASESISTVTPDGKVHRAYKLTLIPEESALVKKIFDVFIETGSLTQVDQYLLTHGYKTKHGKHFTRFSIRSILTNPVYMIADLDAYHYLIQSKVDLFAAEDAFDETHGLMVYNRTNQHPGRANQLNPMDQWIVSVGKHTGLIPGSTWVAVQKRLEQNSSKHHRPPKSNTALLSGLLRCGNCGDYMRPKMTSRISSTGQPIYTYMCTTKERSRRQLCSIQNINGNLLDDRVLTVLSQIESNSDEMVHQILSIKRLLHINESTHHQEVLCLQAQLHDSKAKIDALVESLATASSSSAAPYILERIDELHRHCTQLEQNLDSFTPTLNPPALSAPDFDTIQQLLANFGESLKSYSLEQKRTVIRTCVSQIIWDGQTIHLYFAGSKTSADPAVSECESGLIPL